MQLITLMLRLPWIIFLSKCCSTFLKTNSFRGVFFGWATSPVFVWKGALPGSEELHSEDTLRSHFHIFTFSWNVTYRLFIFLEAFLIVLNELHTCKQWSGDESDRRRRENLSLVTTAQPGAASKTGDPHGWLQQPLTIFRNMIKVSL